MAFGAPREVTGSSDGMVRSKARGQPRLQTGRAQWCAASSKPLGPNSSLRTSQVQCSSSDVSRDHGHRSSLTVWSQVSQASRAEVYMGSIEAHSSTNSAPTHDSVSLNDIFLFNHCLPSLHLNANSFWPFPATGVLVQALIISVSKPLTRLLQIIALYLL